MLSIMQLISHIFALLDAALAPSKSPRAINFSTLRDEMMLAKPNGIEQRIVKRTEALR